MTSMVKRLIPHIYQIKVPLPHNPLEHLNSYLIKSGEENLLVDTGIDSPLSFQSLCEGLYAIGVKPKDVTKILATHFHVDHVGLIPRFRKLSPKIEILIHSVEAELSRVMIQEFDNYKENLASFLTANGAPPNIANLKSYHPAFFTPQAYEELSTDVCSVKDGQEISIGDYNFQAVWTPGHSPGHICLHEPALKTLISGDYFLPTITPHIAQFMKDMDPLTDYLESLEKVANLDIDVVLPGHEEHFTNPKKRIKQLRDHHEQRLMEITEELKDGKATSYVLASRINWDVKYRSWNDFPTFQKYLALGETIAHLNLLKNRGIVQESHTNKTTYHLKETTIQKD